MSISDRLNEYSSTVADVEAAQAAVNATAEGQRLACLQAAAEQQAAAIKAAAKHVPLSQAHTLVGRLHQLVWTYPKAVYDAERLEALVRQLGGTDGQLSECLQDKPGFWSLRKRGKAGG